MPTTLIHVTADYKQAAFYPHCPGSNQIARAIPSRTLSYALLGALQSLGIVVIVDGEVAPDLTRHPTRFGIVDRNGDVRQVGDAGKDRQ